MQPILYVPEQGLAGAGFHVAICVIGVAAVFDGMMGEGSAEAVVVGPFVALDAAGFVIAIALAIARGEAVGVVVGEALVGVFRTKINERLAIRLITNKFSFMPFGYSVLAVSVLRTTVSAKFQ